MAPSKAPGAGGSRWADASHCGLGSLEADKEGADPQVDFSDKRE